MQNSIVKLATMFSVVALMFLASCGNDSTSPTTVKNGLWTNKADFPEPPRGNAAGFVINDKLYLVGGYSNDFNKRYNDVYEYNPTANTWTPKKSFPGVARTDAAAFAIGGKGYVGTGRDDSGNRLKDFWQYDPATDQWTPVADFTDARTGAVGFTISGRGFVGTGNNGSTKNDLWEYLPAPSNTWVSRSTFSKKRENAAVMVINDAAYLVGGKSNSLVYVQEVEKYTANESFGSFELKLALTGKDANGNTITQPQSKEFASTFTINGLGYYLCGSVNGNVRSDVWQYNATKDAWVEFIQLPSKAPARDGALSFAVGNFGYLTTGRQSTFRFDDTWSFDPTGVTK